MTASAVPVFDSEFQTKVCALALRDTVFLRRAEGLVTPDMFESIPEGILAGLSMEHFAKYGQAPTSAALLRTMADRLRSGAIRKDLQGELVGKVKELVAFDISDRDYVIDEVAKFARHQAMEKALLKSVDLKEKGDFGGIEKEMQKALLVGALDADEGIDYWGNIETRSQVRRELAAGLRPPSGISTGYNALDALLYHNGWGIGELTAFMGAAKAGKSTALGEFTKNASLLGKNCLYVSLEVAGAIISDRYDANIAGFPMDQLKLNPNDIESKIKDLAKKAGIIRIHQFPPSSFKPSDLRRLLERYRARGIKFDVVAVDYADIMAPDFRTVDPIENSKSVWIGLRSIAMEEQIVLLTATQANRDGARASIIKATDVAEDYNKIRIADLVISINRTEEERMANECRLFFAASRNQRGEFTVRVKQDIERMRFIQTIMGVE